MSPLINNFKQMKSAAPLKYVNVLIQTHKASENRFQNFTLLGEVRPNMFCSKCPRFRNYVGFIIFVIFSFFCFDN